jgi:hypothetical protein
MGCDIHAHLEIQVDGEWLYYSPVHIGRNYQLFAKMSGVRNHYKINPISMPKGIPADISKTTQLHRLVWDTDGHSDSWLNHSEIVKLIDWIMEPSRKSHFGFNWFNEYPNEVFLFGNSVYSFMEYQDDYPDFLEDVRLVFWFDN